MKAKLLLTSLASVMTILVLVSTSCSSEENSLESDGLIQVDKNGMYTAKMILNVSKYGFDATTRSVDNGWEDKDIIFLTFERSDGSTTKGHAIYDGTKKEWTVSYEQSLIKDAKASCKAFYIDGIKGDEATLTANKIEANYTNGVYVDTVASYYYATDGDLEVTAVIKPITSRIRFKEPGETVDTETNYTLLGIKYIASYNIDSNEFIYKKNAISFSLQEDGYSPYMYGVCADDASPTLTIRIPKHECEYATECKGNIFAIGKSGWMYIPTVTSHNGWQQFLNRIAGYEYVDLGLPSGLKWAKYNVGANNETDGSYTFKWGAITTTGSSAEYKYDISGDSSYDAARAKWGETWRMPTSKEFGELQDNCTVSYKTTDGYNGAILTGPNGQKIYFPTGHYWTSTPNLFYSYSEAYYIYMNNGRKVEPISGSESKSISMMIRPISK